MGGLVLLLTMVLLNLALMRREVFISSYSCPSLCMHSLFVILVWFRKAERKFASVSLDLLIWLPPEK